MDKKWILLGGAALAAYYLTRKTTTNYNQTPSDIMTGQSIDPNLAAKAGFTSNPSSTSSMEIMPTIVNNTAPKTKSSTTTTPVKYPSSTNYGSINDYNSQPQGSTAGAYSSYKINGIPVTQTYYNAYKTANGLV